jgi:polysaccharide biosynthesis transport protein
VINFRPANGSTARSAKLLPVNGERSTRPGGLPTGATGRPVAEQPQEITLSSSGDPSMFGSRHLEPVAPALPFQSHAEVVDQYRLIRTRILRHPLEPQVVLFTSPGQGDGKTVNSINVAAMLSMAKDSDVLIIGGDANGDLNTRLGLEADLPGLAEVLSGQIRIQRAIITTVQYPNLFILPCGANRRDMPELLNSAAWDAVMRYARASFTFVVIDAPPCGLVSDYFVLESAADAVALVVRPDHTNRRLLRSALEEIPRQKFLGVLMNAYRDYFFWRKLDYYGRPWD